MATNQQSASEADVQRGRRSTLPDARTENGLLQDWAGETVFMNPPYGREIRHWMRQAGATVVCLVPARTDTAWWHAHVVHGEIRFLRGRLKFGEAEQGAPFPSAIVLFRPGNGVERSDVAPPSQRGIARHSIPPWCIAGCTPAWTVATRPRIGPSPAECARSTLVPGFVAKDRSIWKIIATVKVERQTETLMP